jgi:mannose-6-phosphate isomerase-like protein (cupin superfamily)
MNTFVDNIEKLTKENENFRKVLFTAKHSQLVVMTIQPGDDIGQEVHDLDQFIRIEEGQGKAVLDGVETEVEDDWAIVIPAGVEHNVVNTGDTPLKLYSIYSPAEHRHDVVHATKAEAEADDEEFDGTTSL